MELRLNSNTLYLSILLIKHCIIPPYLQQHQLDVLSNYCTLADETVTTVCIRKPALVAQSAFLQNPPNWSIHDGHSDCMEAKAICCSSVSNFLTRSVSWSTALIGQFWCSCQTSRMSLHLGSLCKQTIIISINGVLGRLVGFLCGEIIASDSYITKPRHEMWNLGFVRFIVQCPSVSFRNSHLQLAVHTK